MRLDGLTFALLLGITCCSSGFGDEPAAGKQVAQAFQDTDQAKLGYLLYLPKDYDAAKQKSPLLLFLHGSGERGSEISLVAKHGPPKLVAKGQDLPFIVVSPQCPQGQRWQPKQLLGLLDDISSRYAVDSDRIYVTGLSMGGFGTWALLGADPERFAAAVPICGFAEPETVERGAKRPIWIVVGDRDSSRLVSNSLESAKSLQDRGADVKLTVMHGVGHDSWTQTYATPELYDWMLRHRRGD